MVLAVAPLENRFVRLEPFTDALENEVRAALDCDTAAWDRMVSAACGPDFVGWWRSALGAQQQGSRIAYAVRRRSAAARSVRPSINPRRGAA